MRLSKWFWAHIALVSFLFASCGEVQSEFSNYRVYFIFDNAIHQNSNLAQAMTPYSNVFATIRKTERVVNNASVTLFEVQNSQQNTTETSIANAVDLKRTSMLGMNNGVIVGYSNLSDPPTFYAYDRECPNCFDPNNVPIISYPISINNRNTAVCNTCKREYDLNMGGIIVKGDPGKKLTRYRASTTGPYGVLSIN